MDNKRRWMGYDWFKLVMALILLVILVVSLLQPPSPALSAASTSPTVAATSPIEASATAPATATSSPTETPLLDATQTETAQPTVDETMSAAQKSTAVSPPTGDCSKALPTRLAIGQKARVVANLALRKAAGVDQTSIQALPPGSALDIIGGPVCIPSGDRAYRWWQVTAAGGISGWSVEGALNGMDYYLEPLK